MPFQLHSGSVVDSLMAPDYPSFLCYSNSSRGYSIVSHLTIKIKVLKKWIEKQNYKFINYFVCRAEEKRLKWEEKTTKSWNVFDFRRADQDGNLCDTEFKRTLPSRLRWKSDHETILNFNVLPIVLRFKDRVAYLN